MASNWKLRKDKLQESAPSEGESLTDTATVPEPIAFARDPEETPAPLTFDADASPFIFTASEPDMEPQVEEPTFSQFQTVEPTLDVPVFSSGPFAPFASEESPVAEEVPSSTGFAILDREILDREEVAPSLVHTDSDSEVPRVAPFIVDVPPTLEEETPLPPRVLNVRIGNFAAKFPLTQDVAVIGRPDSLLQSYPDVEIELDDAVSRRHAEIRHQGDGYVLVDLRSTNGTLLNGERIVPHQEYPLAYGDRIHLGDRTEIIFE
jgi:hypothetical protein